MRGIKLERIQLLNLVSLKSNLNISRIEIVKAKKAVNIVITPREEKTLFNARVATSGTFSPKFPTMTKVKIV